MARYIVKLSYKSKDYYLDWSTVTDSPITYGVSLDKFKKYIKKEYGKEGLENLPQRLKRVNKKGCSSHICTLYDLIATNRAGKNDKHLTKNEVIRQYCLQNH